MLPCKVQGGACRPQTGSSRVGREEATVRLGQSSKAFKKRRWGGAVMEMAVVLPLFTPMVIGQLEIPQRVTLAARRTRPREAATDAIIVAAEIAAASRNRKISVTSR